MNRHVYSVFLLFMVGIYWIDCWKNTYDGNLLFQCPHGKAISYIKSMHDNGPEDRIWDFRCRNIRTSQGRCQWSGYVNNWDETFAYQCQDNGYIAGIDSYHDNGPEDRRYRFYCCQTLRKSYIHQCYYTGFNQFDETIYHHVPKGYVWRGIVSQHDNGPEDRIFNFEFCKVSQ